MPGKHCLHRCSVAALPRTYAQKSGAFEFMFRALWDTRRPLLIPFFTSLAPFQSGSAAYSKYIAREIGRSEALLKVTVMPAYVCEPIDMLLRLHIPCPCMPS